MQWNQNDTAAIKQGQPETSTVSLTPVSKRAITTQKWQRLVSGIRHAAVHRLSQDRGSLLHMTRAALEFSLCIGGLSSVQKLRRLSKFLEDRLPKSERVERSQDGTSSTKLLCQDCASKV
ncbi:hypothetical protein PENNAL_c0137G08393 [Penicillium nalgiovense]|uniref:Uncharacterized protein n=1 Tax=Penicillium nalgiovense TaxID=60175 RepID=A0A1V6X2Q7_PENNA|nr:hypothetical protein PENNAL_c0137G08393 [Penicillium nalgiovense]